MARALHEREVLGCYYSGYPEWKLRGADGMPVKTYAARTLAVYGMRRLLPEALRPKDRRLFRWQDDAFDRWGGRALESCDFIHALPGQARETFRRARALGVHTVLSHATGPVAGLEEVVRPEFERVGLEFSEETQFDASYYAREEEEYALADFHWAASSVVADRLKAGGVPEEKIWTVGYGVDREIFSFNERPVVESDGFRLLFAGQLSLRKGVRFLLDALCNLEDSTVSVDFFGHCIAEVDADLAAYKGVSPLRFHGPVSQTELSAQFSRADALVLPSLEEGYGLVVIQALACGLPVLVADSVGAKDAVLPRQNGMIFPVADADGLADCIREARDHQWDRRIVAESTPAWDDAAEDLIRCSEQAS